MKNDDVQLIQRVLDGDDTAFSVLVRKYQKPVHALAWRKIGDFHIAEDITQETFLKAYQRLSTLKEPQSFASWLYVITANHCNTWLRKKRLWTQSLEETNSAQLEKATYSGYVIEENERMMVETQREVVKKLLAKLKESDRTVITLYYFGGMTYEEISKFLGVSVGAVKNRVYRAQERLKKEEPMIREVLGNFQITPNLTENIMREVSRLKPVAPSDSKPLIPWAVGVSTLAVVLLMLGVSSQYLSRFQKPYSFDAASEMMVELIEAPVVLNLESKPDIRTQLGNANGLGKGNFSNQQPDEVSASVAEADTMVGKKVLEGVKPVKGDSTFIGTLHPALKAAGGDWSIPRLTGTFGNAFSFSTKIGDGAVWQQANIDWWLLWDMIAHIGYEFQEFQFVRNGKQPAPTPKELQRIKDQTWEKVKASIDRGIPAIAWQPMTVEQRDCGVSAYGWASLVGYDETEKTYIVRHQHYTTEYTVPYNQFGFTDPVGWYCVMILVSEKKPFDRMALEVKSLEHAVAFAHGTRFDLKDAPYTVDAVGFAAYQLWKQALENGDVNIGFTEHSAWIVWEMRENAAAYLREIAHRFPEASSRALFDAAAFYDEEIEAVVRLVNLCKEHESFTKATRQEAVAVLDTALEAEKKAIEKIETALATLPKN